MFRLEQQTNQFFERFHRSFVLFLFIHARLAGIEQPRFQALKVRALSHPDPDVRATAASTLLWDEPVCAELALLRLYVAEGALDRRQDEQGIRVDRAGCGEPCRTASDAGADAPQRPAGVVDARLAARVKLV